MAFGNQSQFTNAKRASADPQLSIPPYVSPSQETAQSHSAHVLTPQYPAATDAGPDVGLDTLSTTAPAHFATGPEIQAQPHHM